MNCGWKDKKRDGGGREGVKERKNVEKEEKEGRKRWVKGGMEERMELYRGEGMEEWREGLVEEGKK